MTRTRLRNGKFGKITAGTVAFFLCVLVLFAFCAVLSSCEADRPSDGTDTGTPDVQSTEPVVQTDPYADNTADADTDADTVSETVPGTDTDTRENPTDTAAFEPSTEPEQTVGETHIAVISDLHVGKQNLTPMPEDKLAFALDRIRELFGRTDALVMAGDLTDRGYDWEYHKFVSVLWSHVDSDTAICSVMGNHEYFRDGVVRFGGETPAFVTQCQQAYCGVMGDLDTDTVVNGIHIIGISARSSAAEYKGCEDFLKTHITAAAEEDPTMPIIVFSHEGLGTLYGTGSGSFDATVQRMLSKYPQIIWLSGHTHFASNDPRMIQQKQYTNIQVGTVGADYWSYPNITPSQPPEAATASQGLLITVDENKIVTVVRYDFTADTVIGQPWVIDVPAACKSVKSFTYTDGRSAEAEKPVIDGTVTPVDVKKDKVTVSFPAATVNDTVSDGVIIFYRVTVTDPATGEKVAGSVINADYYMGVNAVHTVEATLTGLSAGRTYTVSVTAESAWGKVSDPVSADFTTPEQ